MKSRTTAGDAMQTRKYNRHLCCDCDSFAMHAEVQGQGLNAPQNVERACNSHRSYNIVHTDGKL